MTEAEGARHFTSSLLLCSGFIKAILRRKVFEIEWSWKGVMERVESRANDRSSLQL